MTDNKHIHLKVYDNEGTEIEYKVKKSISFAKILQEYCKGKSVSPNTLRLTYKGKEVSQYDSPEVMGMEDGDSLEIMAAQTGG